MYGSNQIEWYMSWLLLVFVLRAFAIEDLRDEVDKLRCALILANISKSIESAISLKLVDFDSKLEFVTRRLVELDGSFGTLHGMLKTEFKALDGKIGALDVRIGALDVMIGALDGRIGAFDDRVEALDVKI